MSEDTLYQINIKAEKSISAHCAALLENSDPTPLAVSHFEEKNTDNWCCTALYNEAPQTDTITTHVANALELDKTDFTLTLEQVPNINWVSHVQSNLKPVEIGRFFIHGSHDKIKAENNPFAIEIDAQEAFGTAHHGTTKGCLNALDHTSQNTTPNKILDLGTGTGILAIAAAKLYPDAHIIATDNDPKAIEIASQNAQKNHQPKIEFFCTEGCSEDLKTIAFDLIIANILAKPLITMADDIKACLSPNAHLILSGILHEQAEDVIATYQDHSLHHQATKQFDEWSTIIFKRT